MSKSKSTVTVKDDCAVVDPYRELQYVEPNSFFYVQGGCPAHLFRKDVLYQLTHTTNQKYHIIRHQPGDDRSWVVEERLAEYDTVRVLVVDIDLIVKG